MESNERFRYYITSITDAFFENNISELHYMTAGAIADYFKGNITYKQLYVIKAIEATFSIASMYEE